MSEDPRAVRWLDDFNRLEPIRPIGDVPLLRWKNFLADGRDFFVAGLHLQAAELGWDEYQLFGCDRSKPFARIDHQGLIWLLDCGRVSQLAEDHADIVTVVGRQRHTYRARDLDPELVCLPWEFLGRND